MGVRRTGQVSGGRGAAALPPELAFLVRHGCPAETLEEAARLAGRWGVTGDEALIASGLMDAEAFYRALAAETRLPFRAGGFAVHPLARSSHAILTGLAPLAAPGEGAVFAFAPRGPVLADMLARGIGADLGLLITTPSGLRGAVFAACADSIARDAAEGLARRKPEESFHGSLTLGQTVATHALAAALGVAALAIGGTAWMAAMLLFSGPFLGLTAIKLAATLEPVPVDMPLRLARDDDRDLPVYTILVPLYRESRVVGRLLRAIRAVDYPALWSKCTKRHRS